MKDALEPFNYFRTLQYETPCRATVYKTGVSLYFSSLTAPITCDPVDRIFIISTNLFVTCFHEFRIYDFFCKSFFFVYFSFKVAAKCLFCGNKQFYLVLKENKKNFVKKIRRDVDSEFVKTCHEHVIHQCFSKSLVRVFMCIQFINKPSLCLKKEKPLLPLGRHSKSSQGQCEQNVWLSQCGQIYHEVVFQSDLTLTEHRRVQG